MDLNSYISGFVDGEGCFCVSFQPSKRHRFGWEVRPSFSVSQNADRAELLKTIQVKWDVDSSGRTDQTEHSSSKSETLMIWWRECCHTSERFR
jgi:hypothetical protein